MMWPLKACTCPGEQVRQPERGRSTSRQGLAVCGRSLFPDGGYPAPHGCAVDRRPLNFLDGRADRTHSPDMKGARFIARVVELGRDRGIEVRIDVKRGKGSHVMLYYGVRKSVVKDRRKEIGAGLLLSMIRQLGLERSDFR